MNERNYYVGCKFNSAIQSEFVMVDHNCGTISSIVVGKYKNCSKLRGLEHPTSLSEIYVYESVLASLYTK